MDLLQFYLIMFGTMLIITSLYLAGKETRENKKQAKQAEENLLCMIANNQYIGRSEKA